MMDRRQLDDLELTRGGGEAEGDDVAHLLVEEGAPDRRRHADVAVLELDRVAEDELVDLGGPRLLVLDDDARAEADPVGRDLAQVDLGELGEPLPELPEARLDELLPLERRLVLAVLAQVAQLHRFPDLVRQRDGELVLQPLHLVVQLGLQVFDHPRLRFLETTDCSLATTR